MKTNDLGLPWEYQEQPEFFDALNIGNDTDEKNAVIESLLKSHHVQSVLDLTCGTGSQVFFLTNRGYKCTGADFSPALLEMARIRALKENVDIKFIDGDMRTLEVSQFDAVITIFNAVGHLTKTDFERAMQNISRNLKEAGIYIFDILNLDAMNDAAVANLSCHMYKKVNDTQIHRSQCSTIDRDSGRLTSYDIFMTQQNADIPQRFNREASLQLYTAKELREILAKNGFETIDQYGMDGSEFLEGKTTNILTVARKR